jgi:serine protease Do
VPGGRGLLVQKVARNSPADYMGIRGGSIKAIIAEQEILVGGDIIVEVMGIPLAEEGSVNNVFRKLDSLEKGGRITIRVLRAGETMDMVTFK